MSDSGKESKFSSEWKDPDVEGLEELDNVIPIRRLMADPSKVTPEEIELLHDASETPFQEAFVGALAIDARVNQARERSLSERDSRFEKGKERLKKFGDKLLEIFMRGGTPKSW